MICCKAPEMAPGSVPSTFSPVLISGSGGMVSPPFMVTTDEWVIRWSYVPVRSHFDFSAFGFFVYPRGETALYVETVFSDFTDGATSGMTYSYAGPGEYYMKVLAANLESWVIVISPP